MALFGQELPKDGPTPDIFHICLNYLELHALEIEGIFRISGQKVRIEEMKTEFEKGKRFDFSEKDEIHDVSGLFRMWLQMLPEPIIPYEYYMRMVDCGKPADKKKSRQALKQLADDLPSLRRSMLQQLIRMLRLLSLYHDTNKMTASNLAVVMGPNICRPLTMSATTDALAQHQCVTNAVVQLIDDYEFILPREPLGEDKHLVQVKRESRRFDASQISEELSRQESSSGVTKEAEDAIDSKLSLSLSDLKPEHTLAPPKSARSAPRGRMRGASANPRTRGFSNALEWLVTSVQEDALDDQIAPEEEPAESAVSSEPPSALASVSGSAPTTPRDSPATQPSHLSSSSKKRSTKRSKTLQDSTTDLESSSSVPASPRESSSTPSGSAPKKERSKKLKSESSTNSTSETSTSTSEPPSPRDSKHGLSDSMKSNGSTSSSSTKKKSKSKLQTLDEGIDQASSETPPKSPRRSLAPPSRESSLRGEGEL